jgi:hypothetical protein
MSSVPVVPDLNPFQIATTKPGEWRVPQLPSVGRPLRECVVPEEPEPIVVDVDQLVPERRRKEPGVPERIGVYADRTARGGDARARGYGELSQIRVAEDPNRTERTIAELAWEVDLL